MGTSAFCRNRNRNSGNISSRHNIFFLVLGFLPPHLRLHTGWMEFCAYSMLALYHVCEVNKKDQSRKNKDIKGFEYFKLLEL